MEEDAWSDDPAVAAGAGGSDHRVSHERGASTSRLWHVSTDLKPPRARVLIADDEAHVREVLRHFLTREGYLVSTVEDGRGALDAVTTFHPEVILVDMVMPGLSAIDVLAELRRAGVTVPVVLISGQVIVREGFFGVLSKPFEFRRVAELVAAAVDHGRTSGA